MALSVCVDVILRSDIQRRPTTVPNDGSRERDEGADEGAGGKLLPRDQDASQPQDGIAENKRRRKRAINIQARNRRGAEKREEETADERTYDVEHDVEDEALARFVNDLA